MSRKSRAAELAVTAYLALTLVLIILPNPQTRYIRSRPNSWMSE